MNQRAARLDSSFWPSSFRLAFARLGAGLGGRVFLHFGSIDGDDKLVIDNALAFDLVALDFEGEGELFVAGGADANDGHVAGADGGGDVKLANAAADEVEAGVFLVFVKGGNDVSADGKAVVE